MADGQDPLADFQNTIGLQGLIGPNPYLKYQGQIPMAGFYTGQNGSMGPTDAQGNPIQSFTDANNAAQAQYQQQLAAYNAQGGQGQGQGQGTTINSNPFASVPNVQGQNAPATEPRGGLNLQQWNALSPQQRSSAMGPLGQYAAGNAMMPSDSFVANHNNPSGVNPTAQAALGFMNSGISGFNQMAQQPAAPAQGTPPTPPDMRQAYLDALARPGKVNTPGAQMLPGTTPTGPAGAGQQPSVMQAFLAAHPQGGTPAPAGGGYSNQGFFSTLNALQQGHPQ